MAAKALPLHEEAHNVLRVLTALQLAQMSWTASGLPGAAVGSAPSCRSTQALPPGVSRAQSAEASPSQTAANLVYILTVLIVAKADPDVWRSRFHLFWRIEGELEVCLGPHTTCRCLAQMIWRHALSPALVGTWRSVNAKLMAPNSVDSSDAMLNGLSQKGRKELHEAPSARQLLRVRATFTNDKLR